MLEIAKSDIVARLKFDNPWWEGQAADKIQFEDKPRRKYFEQFFKAITDTSVRRAMVLMGPRRVGKTVMVYHAIRALLDDGTVPTKILYLSLETPIYTGLSLERILGFFQEFSRMHEKPDYSYFSTKSSISRIGKFHLKSLVDSYPECKFKIILQLFLLIV